MSKYYITVLLSVIFLHSCTKRLMPSVNKISPLHLSLNHRGVVTIHRGNILEAPCEPSICINPVNNQHIIAGSVLDNVYVSQDGGLTWKKSRMKSSFGVYGDPVIRFTQEGTPLYAHLSNPKGRAYQSDEFLDRIVVQRSSDQGVTWTDGSYPECDRSKDHDKQWMATDPVYGNILMAWTEFDKYGSDDVRHKSRILFSSSSDGGISWSKALNLAQFEGDCQDGDLTTEGAHPAIGVDGTYYVVWGFDQKLYMDMSSDQGKTWLDADIMVAEQPGGWAYDIPGIGRANGMPIMDCDHSKGPYRGNLYISWSDQRNGERDTDIWLISSEDRGRSWSAPIRVNDDPAGKHQFFSWMDIDPSTGYIYIVFYDRREYTDEMTDVFLAYSTDGGKSFKNIKISESPFKPEPILFFGDYNDISAHNGIIRPIWTRQDKNILSIQTSLINIK